MKKNNQTSFNLFSKLIIIIFVSCYFYGNSQTYCTPTVSHFPNDFYINNFQILDTSTTILLNNSSNQNDDVNGYSDYTGSSVTVPDLTLGSSYTTRITLTNTHPWNKTTGHSIWIDYNQDGDFNDANERVWGTTTNSNLFPHGAVAQGTFIIPSSAIAGTTRMRIASRTYFTPNNSCSMNYDSNNGGEYEDYNVNIILSPDPSANNDNLGVVVNSTAGGQNQIDVSTNDTIGSDGGDLDDYALAVTATNGAVTEITDGVFQYIPNLNFVGNDSFTYNLCDSNNDCSVATVNILVNFGQCIPSGNSAGSHYITNLNIVGETTLNNTSGDNNGYVDFTGSVAALELIKGTAYPTTLSVFNGDGQTMGWSLYIDLNADGDFTDANERLYDTNGTEAIPFATQNITVPTSAITGRTVLRVGTRRYYSSNQPCGQTAQPEEFEDYLVDLQIDATSPQEIDITGQGNAILDGATAVSANNDTDFGAWDIYTLPLTKTYTITNNGGLPLTLLGAPVVTLTGDVADFSISQQPTNNLLTSSQSTTFTIDFNPSSIGIKQAIVSLGSDDADENPYTFLIQGEGIQIFPDTDGDGVPDNADGDDDNDGILDEDEDARCKTYPYSTQVTTIFLNETFGEDFTGSANRNTIDANVPGASSTYCFEDGTGLCGIDADLKDSEYTVFWNAQDVAPSFASDFWYLGEDHTAGDTNGRMALFNADENPGVFYEAVIDGVTPNVEITYGFSAINLDRSDAPGIATRERPDVLIEIVDPNGVIISSASSGLIAPTDAANLAGDWVQVQTTFTSGFSQFTVRLSNNQPGGLGNDLAIDDIYVEQLLCDFDGDGIPDTIDLDNDNDGIPNVVELGLLDTDKDGTLLGDGWVDTNNNGVHDSYESGATPINSDNDSIPNYMDLDSDNDGIFDAVEYDNMGDVDIDGDGFGDGTDENSGIANDGLDGDGILAIIDGNDIDANSNDHGTNAYTTPLDSDGDSIPDYLDTYNNMTGVYDINTTNYSNYDADNNGVIDGNIDVDLDGILDAFDTDTSVYGSPRDLNDKYTLFFDGRNDYVEDTSILGGLNDASLLTWIKIEPGASGTRTILGQNNFSLLIQNNGRLRARANGINLDYNTALAENIWIHVAAVYDNSNGNFKLYVNGEEINITSTSGSLNADTTKLTLGRNSSTNNDYFEGEIDEVRVFNKALNELELQRMVYQELDDNLAFNTGKIIPLEISSTIGSSLIRYFKMDGYKGDILDDKTTATIDENTGAKIYNIKNIYPQTAPLPYETIADGDWSTTATWLHGPVWDITDEASNKDWAIVHIKNTITTSNDHGTLGLFVDQNQELEIANNALSNSWYLELNGFIDLENESQLIQTNDSKLVVGANGVLEKDQQGTENLYTYNYFSSPVHSSNPDVNVDGNETYTVEEVMLDGSTTSNPQPINFIGGHNGSNATNPISIASHWIWRYANNASSYYNWIHTKDDGIIKVGEGYTMKGPGTGAIANEQNYTFKGVPNNGEINHYIDAGNEYLIGNPYPSAIDGSAFILDNPHLNGTLYFWEHYGGGSHVTTEYQGGYGLYNLSGGTPPLSGTQATAQTDIDQGGIATKIPRRYIPVGQGFFIKSVSNGNTKFENDQRIYVTEAGNTNSWFFKSNQTTVTNFEVEEDLRPKFRFGFKSPESYGRQILLTVDENTSLGYDWAYDGIKAETYPEDMYWTFDNEDYLIQAVSETIVSTQLPLTVTTKNGGIIEIDIDALENVDANLDIYLKDNDVYHNLRASKYITTVAAGTISDRFEIVFTPNPNTLSTQDFEDNNSFAVFSENGTQITISNPKNNSINKVQAINMLGQVVFETEINNSNSRIEIPVNLSTGAYVFKIESEDFTITKKIIINP